jgi:hypothetical protein
MLTYHRNGISFLLAFMGVHILFIPGMKPIPGPDPPFISAKELYQAVEKAHTHVSKLKKHIEADLVFLTEFIEQ